MCKVYIIKNKQHKLLPEQENIVNQIKGEKEVIDVPPKGWTLAEMDKFIRKTTNSKIDTIFIFVSPIPYLLSTITYKSAKNKKIKVFLFHNDKREKKELPNGKIVFTVPKIGWQLIEIGK